MPGMKGQNGLVGDHSKGNRSYITTGYIGTKVFGIAKHKSFSLPCIFLYRTLYKGPATSNLNCWKMANSTSCVYGKYIRSICNFKIFVTPLSRRDLCEWVEHKGWQTHHFPPFSFYCSSKTQSFCAQDQSYAHCAIKTLWRFANTETSGTIFFSPVPTVALTSPSHQKPL